ncbi:MAG: EAL domain-containing protein [Oceanospirillales bacterium]|nr:EAL domain-containing protein [Oceanospirillales bacterium]
MNTEVLLNHGVSVAQICQTDVICCAPGDSLESALKLMSERRIGSVLVCDDHKPVGILTGREAMSCCLNPEVHARSQLLADVMSTQLLVVRGEASIDDVGVELLGCRLKHAVVVDASGKLIGIVSESDVVNNQGVEHDLFLRSVSDIAPVEMLWVSADSLMRDIISQMHDRGQSSALVRNGTKTHILTDTDVIRILASGEPLERPVLSFSPPELVSIDESISLFIARKIFLRHGFRHLGVVDASGQVTRVLSYADILRSVERDYVSRLRQMLRTNNEALEQSMQNLRLIERVINASLEGVVVTDASGAIQSVNPAFTAITGYEAHEVIGKNPSILSSGRHDRTFYDRMWHALRQQGEWQGEIWNRSKRGEVYPEWLSITAITDAEGKVTQYAAIFHDLTEAKRSEARIQQMALFDDLTRLANRRLFQERLEMASRYALDSGEKFAVLAIDLDMFKRINDRFGQEGGDEVLKTIAGRLENALDTGDTASRPGGDEFNLIIGNVSEDGLHEQIEHLFRVISTPVLVNATEVRITAGIGIALFPIDGDNGDALLSSAEAALHQAKERGHNVCSYFSEELHQKRRSRYLIAAQLHHALERNEFSLVYQPKISLTTGEVVGAEALLRWHNAELGAVPADLFVPLAEDTGLINEIGDWVLEEAVAQAKTWCESGCATPIAINLSARQFQDGSILQRIENALSGHGLDSRWLSVELTETCFLANAEQTADTLLALRERGVGVSIDDFGTGFSSLSYIRTMSLDHLKIDRSFISSITGSNRDRQLVSAIIAMSQALGLSVVAEGVETLEQLEVLRELGCDQVQGYLICRPQRADDFVSWYEQYSITSFLNGAGA